MVIVATTDTMQKRIYKRSLFNEKCLMRLFYLVLLLFLCSLYWSFVYRFTKQTRTFCFGLRNSLIMLPTPDMFYIGI